MRRLELRRSRRAAPLGGALLPNHINVCDDDEDYESFYDCAWLVQQAEECGGVFEFGEDGHCKCQGHGTNADCSSQHHDDDIDV